MTRARLAVVLLFLLPLLVVPSRSELRKTFHSKIGSSSSSSSSSRFLFHHYNHVGRDRGHDQHHQTHKKQLESTTIAISETENDIATEIPEPTEEEPVVTQHHATGMSYERSLPLRVLNCMAKVSLLDCSKLYLLQNMESRDYHFATSGNITYDVQQILLPSYRRPDNKLFEDRLYKFNSSEVDRRINQGLALLFNERQVDIKFLPGFGLKITPSQGDTLEFSIKKHIETIDQPEDDDQNHHQQEGRGRKDEKDKDDRKDRKATKKTVKTLLRFGVPVVLLPTMLLASVMPMMIPVLKFATFFTSFVNHAALAAAVMYLAKQHAQEQEEKQTVYFNAGYN